MSQKDVSRVLVTGATGYVGSRLVPRLLDAGHRVRAASRSIEKLSSRVWASHPDVDLVQMDMIDPASVEAAIDGCSHAYYLVHSMNPSSRDFAEADRVAAKNMVHAGNKAELSQLIYLGGLGEIDTQLSKHLKSRAEVSTILQSSNFPTTVLRAAMIIGSGSASFEILRYLVERLPVMVTPKWVSTPSQPIAIRNVLKYLIECLGAPEVLGRTFDIGGSEIVSYRDLMEIYAEEAGLPERLIIPVPVFTPGLSSYWIKFVTPVPAYIARPLADGLRNPAVCTESDIKAICPQELLTCREAIRLALDMTQHHRVESHWTDAGKVPPAEWCNASDPSWAGGTVYFDVRRVVIDGSPADAWKAISRIGGTSGWYYANWLWNLRGTLDWIVGGVGRRRGRRHPEELRPGDALDFWRVKAAVAEKRLLLIAEMKLPGEAALEFQVRSLSDGRTEIVQIARFLPRGLAGILYWHLVAPLHEFVFNGMLRGIARATGRPMLLRPEKLSQKSLSQTAFRQA